ncbi:MAG TPA: YihY/virulence factor BrkB family protein [Pseudonocardiaceae bacterium]|nr:YihY/virulence factor BrkB family protein [Pseudonocardiaceae bacterium]
MGRVDEFQRRHVWAGLPLAVVYKFIDDQGTYLAALITYYGFVSLFPLLLLLVSVLGFVLHGNPGLQHQVLHSALRDFPIVGDQIGQNVHSLHGNALALTVGIVVSLVGGLNATLAAQTAMNRVWAVPRRARPDLLRAWGRGLLVLVVVGTGFLLTTGLSGLTTGAGSYGAEVGIGLRIAATALAVALNAALFLFAFRVLTARAISLAQLWPGALSAAVAWQALQEVGTFLVAHELKGTSATYGVFSVVLGLLAWIYLTALVMVFCAEVNVVRAQQFWPRSLTAPFTDHAPLTDADRRAYTAYTTTEQHTSRQHIKVDFSPPNPDRQR